MALALLGTLLLPGIGIALGGIAVRYSGRHGVTPARKAAVVITLISTFLSAAYIVFGLGALLLDP